MNLKQLNINEILLLTRNIRQKGMPFYSNYFNQCKDIEKEFSVWVMPHALVFEWDDMGIRRIYFFASDKKELKYILSNISKESVIDFLTKDEKVLKECFEDAGYKLYLRYGRFCIKTGNVEAEELRHSLENDDTASAIFNAPYGELASESDAVEIDRHLRRVFDPYEAHFYTLDKIREHIRKGWVWVAKEKGKIIAGNLFEIQGKKVYGAYMWNDGGVDVLCSLNHKINEYLCKVDAQHYYCWMRLNNERIIRYNMKYNGYVADGLYDMIYVKK